MTARSGYRQNTTLLRTSGVRSQLVDLVFRNATLVCASLAFMLVVGVGILLFAGSRAAMVHSGLGFFVGEKWIPNPPTSTMHTGSIFGVLPFLYGTLVTSLLALLIAVPIGVGSAIFLAFVAPSKLSTPLSFFIEMLAAVPSIVYGYWGLIYLVPILQNLETWASQHFGHFPMFANYTGTGTGSGYLAAGLVLTLMILPFITAVSRDVLHSVPRSQMEASLALGATKWESIKGVMLKYASGGVIGGVMLGLGRAIGETMAVTMVIGGTVNLPHLSNLNSFSLFRTGYTMTSLLMDQYPSPDTALHLSALTEVALSLFMITIVVNTIAKGLVWLTAMSVGSTSIEMAKSFVTSGIKVIGWIAVLGLFAIQISHDIATHGISGIFQMAGVVFLIFCALFVMGYLISRSKARATWRKVVNFVGLASCSLCELIASCALVGLVCYVVQQGLPALHSGFFRFPNPANPSSAGMLNSVVGTAELVVMASIMGIPVGILGGIYLAEYGQGRLGFVLRFFVDLLNGVPSIVLGIFAFALIVLTTGSNFGYAGGFSLGILMIPTVTRTTEELMRLVPMSLREASLGLGATRARTVWKVVLPAVKGGIVTGALLGVARVSGETAPLIMVGCSSQATNFNPHHALASLPVSVYILRNYPNSLNIEQSWTAALVLVALVLAASTLARLLTRKQVSSVA